jgi:ABC-type bacteriocin/lantibiotic exporter with double-glycine peptidase domain
MGHTLFASDGMFVLLTFLPIIFYLVLTVFAIYFVIKVIKFMNEKTQLDREKNEKLTEIIKVLNQVKKD